MSRISDEELRRLSGAASPGPWKASDNGHYWQIDSEMHGQIGDACSSKFIHANGTGASKDADQSALIAHANAALIALAPALAAEVLQLREALKGIAVSADDDDGWTSDGHERCTEAAAAALTGGHSNG